MKLKATLSALTLGLFVANSVSAMEYQHIRNAMVKRLFSGNVR